MSQPDERCSDCPDLGGSGTLCCRIFDNPDPLSPEPPTALERQAHRARLEELEVRSIQLAIGMLHSDPKAAAAYAAIYRDIRIGQAQR